MQAQGEHANPAQKRDSAVCEMSRASMSMLRASRGFKLQKKAWWIIGTLFKNLYKSQVCLILEWFSVEEASEHVV